MENTGALLELADECIELLNEVKIYRGLFYKQQVATLANKLSLIKQDILFSSINVSPEEGACIDIIFSACEVLEVKFPDLRSPERGEGLRDARKMIYYLLYHKAGLTKKAIGRKFNRTHGTVISALKSHEDLMETDKQYQIRFESLLNSGKELAHV